MGFGIGDFAVQIIYIDRVEEAAQDPGSSFVHIQDPVPVAQDQDQVGQLLKLRAFPIDIDQGFDVLSLVRAGHGQDHGFSGILQEPRNLRMNRGTVAADSPGWIKIFQIHSRGNDLGQGFFVIGVDSILFQVFLAGAGDDQLGAVEGNLFSFNPFADFIFLLQLCGRHTPGHQS